MAGEGGNVGLGGRTQLRWRAAIEGLADRGDSGPVLAPSFVRRLPSHNPRTEGGGERNRPETFDPSKRDTLSLPPLRSSTGLDGRLRSNESTSFGTIENARLVVGIKTTE